MFFHCMPIFFPLLINVISLETMLKLNMVYLQMAKKGLIMSRET